MLATSYLPRRWPAKYFHRCESFRPCSGWEREFSSLLVTSEFFFTACRSAVHRLTHAGNYIELISITFIINHLTIQIIASRSVAVHYILLLQNCRSLTPRFFEFRCCASHSTQNLFRKSPRPISNTRLKMLPLLHLCPINVIFYDGTY